MMQVVATLLVSKPSIEETYVMSITAPTHTRISMKALIGSTLLSTLLFGSPTEAYEFPIQSYTIHEGLPIDDTRTLTCDHRGYLWAGTIDGLARFDGIRWKIYAPQNTAGSLPTRWIMRLWTDVSGTMWVGTAQRGLHRWNEVSDSFDHFLEHHTVWDVRDYEDHQLLVATNHGLYQLNPKDGQVSKVWSSPVYRIQVLGAGEVMLADQNTLWRANLYSGKKEQLWNNERVWGFHLEPNGTLWTTTEQGLYTYDIHRRTLTKKLSGYRINTITPAHLSAANELFWLGTNQDGFMLWDKHLDKVVYHSASQDAPYRFKDFQIRQMVTDPQGLAWAATDDGLKKIVASPFEHALYGTRSARWLPKPMVTSIIADGDAFVFSMHEGGVQTAHNNLQRASEGVLTPKISQSLLSPKVTVVRKTRQGDWLVSSFAGLNRVTAQGDVEVLIKDHLTSTILEDSDGQIWAGTEGGNVFIFDKAGKVVRQLSSDAANNMYLGGNIYGLTQALDGNIWIATPSGVMVVDKQGKPLFHLNDQGPDHLRLSDRAARQIYADATGAMWVGTDGNGLNKVVVQQGVVQVTRYDTAHGWHYGMIRSLIADDHGKLWIGTSQNIVRFDPSDETFRHFGRNEGVLIDHMMIGTATKTSQGELVFGGVRGILKFKPDAVMGDLLTPTATITGFKVNGQEVPLSKVTDLSRDQNTLHVYFSALDAKDAAAVHYRYKLDGVDKDWRIAEGSQATYTELAAGSYTFHVQAGREGRWQNAATALPIQLGSAWLPSFTSWLVWSTLMLGVASALAAFMWYRWDWMLAHLRAWGRRHVNGPNDGVMGDTLYTLLGSGILSNFFHACKKRDRERSWMRWIEHWLVRVKIWWQQRRANEEGEIIMTVDGIEVRRVVNPNPTKSKKPKTTTQRKPRTT